MIYGDSDFDASFEKISSSMAGRISKLEQAHEKFFLGDFSRADLKTLFMEEDFPFKMVNLEDVDPWAHFYGEYAQNCVALALAKAQVALDQMDLLIDLKRNRPEIKQSVDKDIDIACKTACTQVSWSVQPSEDHRFMDQYDPHNRENHAQSRLYTHERLQKYFAQASLSSSLVVLPMEGNVEKLLVDLSDKRQLFAKLNYAQIDNRLEMAWQFFAYLLNVEEKRGGASDLFQKSADQINPFLENTCLLCRSQLRSANIMWAEGIETSKAAGYVSSSASYSALDFEL